MPHTITKMDFFFVKKKFLCWCGNFFILLCWISVNVIVYCETIAKKSKITTTMIHGMVWCGEVWFRLYVIMSLIVLNWIYIVVKAENWNRDSVCYATHSQSLDASILILPFFAIFFSDDSSTRTCQYNNQLRNFFCDNLSSAMFLEFSWVREKMLK